MSRMLTFFDAVWASARDHAVAGRRHQALTALAPLLSSPAAPERLTLLAHRLAARLFAAAENYRKARKHLRIAEKCDPHNAEIHFELAQAQDRDPYGCDRRAAYRYQLAVKSAPRTPKYLAAFGRSLIRLNRVSRGVRYLREAAAKAPCDAVVLSIVVEGLREADRMYEAYKLVALAKFRAPSNKDVAQLWNDVKFQLAQSSQTGAPRKAKRAVVLPFVKTISERFRLVTGESLRVDPPARIGPHFTRLRAYRSEPG